MNKLILDGNPLTIEDIYRASTASTSVSFDTESKKCMRASRKIVERRIERSETVYGVTTEKRNHPPECRKSDRNTELKNHL
jgi:histidine ammonia-lyase